ncbi:precorrin-3B C17-methyltransferase [Candidatus Moduliflexus flocculans]|uniref:Precorrin-3B C17-methyltransferase n=1 Tax=Candidatus Moduliflexus flocculans TaxID=1499966 RepID=A0A081BQZ0_9BACT|nr:precorrin-3B C17-methyltransferase [Candidatus Moduliflexus flocculans]
MATLFLVGIGPGGREHLTLNAIDAFARSEVIVGYAFYLELIQEFLAGKTVVSSGMTQELDRCRQAIDFVKQGRNTSLISTGDPGLYGMAGPALELADGIDIKVIPGVSAAFAAAAEVGAPLMHDMCAISLSDLLTPWERILSRLEHAAQADFVIALYNPKSHGRPNHIEQAVEMLLRYKSPQTPVASVKNAGRSGAECRLTTLAAVEYDFIDMKTVVIIGNAHTYVKDGRMITPRGYAL